MRALVTGASAGIGAAFAERLAKDGYDVTIVARRGVRLQEFAERLRRDYSIEAEPVVADLSDPDQLALLSHRLHNGPAVDLLVNNAGFGAYMPFAQLPSARAAQLIRVQAEAPVALTSAVLPRMISTGRGAIINIASLLAFSGFSDSPMLPSRAIYSATKSFLVTFSQLLSQELKDTGVRVMVVCPGFVKTEFHHIQGMDVSNLPFVAPAEVVVQAAMAGLAAGEVFCLPTMADTTPLDRLRLAEQELLGGGRSGTLAPRYETHPA